MSVATALARAASRSISTISRTRARSATAMAVAAPTAPTPMIPTFMAAPPRVPRIMAGRVRLRQHRGREGIFAAAGAETLEFAPPIDREKPPRRTALDAPHHRRRRRAARAHRPQREPAPGREAPARADARGPWLPLRSRRLSRAGADHLLPPLGAGGRGRDRFLLRDRDAR